MRRSGQITRSSHKASRSARRIGVALVVALSFGCVGISQAAASGVSQQEQEVKRVVAEIEAAHQHIDQLVEEYVQALDHKATLDIDIAASITKIDAQQAELGQVETQLGNVAVQKFIDGGSGGLGPLFSDPAAIGDGLQKDQLTRVALNVGSATTDDFEQLIKDYNTEKAKLEKAQAEVVSVAAEAERKRVQAETESAALEARLVQEKAKLGNLIEQEQQRQVDVAAAKHAQDVAAYQAQQSSKKSSGAGGGNGGGGNGGGNSGGAVPVPGDGSSSGGSDGGGSNDGGANDGSSSGGGGNPAPAVSGSANVAVNAALNQLGVPYRFATSNPGVSFDCSGLTSYAWGQAGVGLPHQSASQYASVPHVDPAEAQPGDLIFYYHPISHVGIYLGNGQLVHAPATGDHVKISSVNWSKVVGVGRPG